MRKKKGSARFGKWGIAAFIALTGIVLGLCQVVTAAEDFPKGAVTVIVPFRPGGGTDIEVRNIIPFVQKHLGTSVVAKSMPGASTTIGAAAAARAKPDGYTIICLPQPTGILAQEFHGLKIKEQDFEPIYGWFEGPMDVSVKADSPYKTFLDLVSVAQKEPLKASLAGIGSIDHLHTLLLQKYVGMKSTTIPYQGGGPSTAAVIKGEVVWHVGLSTTSVRFVRNKQLRVLAILGPEAIDALSDVPTIYDLGFNSYPNVSFIRGVLAPPGTPPSVVNKLETAFRKAVDDPGFREVMKKQGRPVKPFSREKMKEALQNGYALAKEYVPFMKETANKK